MVPTLYKPPVYRSTQHKENMNREVFNNKFTPDTKKKEDYFKQLLKHLDNLARSKGWPSYYMKGYFTSGNSVDSKINVAKYLLSVLSSPRDYNKKLTNLWNQLDPYLNKWSQEDRNKLTAKIGAVKTNKEYVALLHNELISCKMKEAEANRKEKKRLEELKKKEQTKPKDWYANYLEECDKNAKKKEERKAKIKEMFTTLHKAVTQADELLPENWEATTVFSKLVAAEAALYSYFLKDLK